MTQNTRQVLAALDILQIAQRLEDDKAEIDRIVGLRKQLLKRAVEAIADELAQPVLDE